MYRLTLNASSDMTQGSDHLSVYFKGDQGLTQTLSIPLIDGLYQTDVNLLDVGNVNTFQSLFDQRFFFDPMIS